CVLREGRDYVIQPAARGIHLTLRPWPTSQLKAVSNLVAAGGDVDGLLRDNGYGVRCDGLRKTRANGDRCAFWLIQATEVGGSLVESAANRIFWKAAIADGELSD